MRAVLGGIWSILDFDVVQVLLLGPSMGPYLLSRDLKYGPLFVSGLVDKDSKLGAHTREPQDLLWILKGGLNGLNSSQDHGPIFLM